MASFPDAASPGTGCREIKANPAADRAGYDGSAPRAHSAGENTFGGDGAVTTSHRAAESMNTMKGRHRSQTGTACWKWRRGAGRVAGSAAYADSTDAPVAPRTAYFYAEEGCAFHAVNVERAAIQYDHTTAIGTARASADGVTCISTAHKRRTNTEHRRRHLNRTRSTREVPTPPERSPHRAASACATDGMAGSAQHGRQGWLAIIRYHH